MTDRVLVRKNWVLGWRFYVKPTCSIYCILSTSVSRKNKPEKKILVILDPSLNSLHLKNQGARKMRGIHTIYQLSQLSPNWAQRKTRRKIIWAIKVCIIFLRDIRRSFVICSLAQRRKKK